MIAIFGKRKVTDEKVANIFVNTILEAVEEGFPKIAELINDSPEFVAPPNVDSQDYGRFLMIVIAANISTIPMHFNNGHDREIIKNIIVNFSEVFEMEMSDFAQLIKDYQKLMSRVNAPSKNVLYAISKTLFCKYELNNFQSDYFKQMKTPNPIFLKYMDEATKNYLWNWSAFVDKYKVV